MCVFRFDNLPRRYQFLTERCWVKHRRPRAFNSWALNVIDLFLKEKKLSK